MDAPSRHKQLWVHSTKYLSVKSLPAPGIEITLLYLTYILYHEQAKETEN